MKFLLLSVIVFLSPFALGAKKSAKGGVFIQGLDVKDSIEELKRDVQDLKSRKQGGSAKTAYVNLMEAFEKTKQGRRVKAQLEKTAEKAKKEFKSLELKIQKEEESLKKEAPLLSEQARAQKIQQLQQKFVNFQRDVKNKDLELQNLQNQLMNPVIERLKQVIGELAKRENYLVVENINSDVLWVSPESDLTQKVHKEFNKKYK